MTETVIVKGKENRRVVIAPSKPPLDAKDRKESGGKEKEHAVRICLVVKQPPSGSQIRWPRDRRKRWKRNEITFEGGMNESTHLNELFRNSQYREFYE